MNNIVLHISRKHTGFVAPGRAIVFDNVLSLHKDIGYDASTGIITFMSIGQYRVDWWVATEPSLSVIHADTALKTSQDIWVFNCTSRQSVDLRGCAAISVNSVPVTAELINASDDRLQFASAFPVKAALSIMTEDDFRSTYHSQ